MMNNIRSLTGQDRESWEILWQGYLEFYESTVPNGTGALAFTIELRRRLRADTG